MLEDCQRHVDSGHRRDVGPVEPRGVDDRVAVEGIAVSLRLDGHAPPRRLAQTQTFDGNDSRVASHLRSHRARSARERLRQSTRIDVALVRVEQPGDDTAVIEPERMHRFHLGRADHLQVESQAGRDRDEVVEVVDALGGVTRPEGLRVAIGDRVFGVGRQLRIHPPGVVTGALAEPTVGERGHVAGRVPGRPSGQFVFLDQHRVGVAGRGQVPLDRRSDGTAADDDDLGVVVHRRSSK